MKPAAPTMHGHDVYERFRKAKPGGPLRRLLADQLVRLNEGLIVKLCAQLLGRDADGNRSYRGLRHPAGRVYDADLLEWEDAMQIARMAFCHALEKFDPGKSSIAWYARWWVKDYFDRNTAISAGITTPQKKNDQRPGVETLSPLPPPAQERGAWLGDVLGTEEGGVLAVEGLTPSMLAEWEETGEWPETLLEALEREKAKEVGRVVVSVPAALVRDALDAFLADRCRFGTGAGVTEAWDVWNAYRVVARRLGQRERPRRDFEQALRERGVKHTWKWNGKSSSRKALAGVHLVAGNAASMKSQKHA